MAAHIPEFSLLLLYHKYPSDLLSMLPHAYTLPYFSNDEEIDIEGKSTMDPTGLQPKILPSDHEN